MDTVENAELAELATSSCDHFVSSGKVSHKYEGNGLRKNTRDVSEELNLFLEKYNQQD